MAKLVITARILPDGNTFTVTGRDAWALSELLKAGQRGCTYMDHPAPRLSRCICNLRRKYSLIIKTVLEVHPDRFGGAHARYVLRSNVEIIARSDEPQKVAA